MFILQEINSRRIEGLTLDLNEEINGHGEK